MTLDVYPGRKTTIQQQLIGGHFDLQLLLKVLVVGSSGTLLKMKRCIKMKISVLKLVIWQATVDPCYNDTVCYQRFGC